MKKSSWERASPEAKARAQAFKRQQARARYRYMRTVLNCEPWKAREGQHSVLAMQSFFPGHEFPPELVKRHKSGPKPKGKP